MKYRPKLSRVEKDKNIADEKRNQSSCSCSEMKFNNSSLTFSEINEVLCKQF